MPLTGRSFGVVGALAAFPLRLAERAVAVRGGRLRRGVGRGTTDVVFARSLLGLPTAAIEDRLAAAGDRRRLGEGGLLRALDLVPPPPAAGLSRAALIERSGLAPESLDRLALFDAYESGGEPFSFRDAVLARKHAGLIAAGADWAAVARAVHRFGPVASLTAEALHVGDCGTIYAGSRDSRRELDGQLLLDLGAPAADADALFEAAEAAEAAGDLAAAARLYRRCLDADPRDATAAFNRGNVLRALGQAEEAAGQYLRAAKRDPGFVEAWYNLGCLLEETGRAAAARRALGRAVALDPGYADAVYNLARLAWEAGDSEAARSGWERYLALDPGSEWSRTAARGLALLARAARDRA